MKELLLGMIGVSFFGAACATPLPVVRLWPRDGNVTWVAGRAVTARAHGGVRAAAAFERQSGRAVGFRVEVQNDSGATLEIDPKDMVFSSCATENHCSARQPVVDPEEMLIALDQARSEQEAHAANSATADSALLFLAVTADIADVADGHSHHAGERTMLAGINLKGSESTNQQTLTEIDAEKVAWSTSTLRRTTLPEGHGAAGLVYVPLDPEARYVWLDVRVGGHDFWFPFQQSVASLPRPTNSHE